VNEAENMSLKLATRFDVDAVRADFPILSQTVYNKPLVYFDNAASAQKPNAVIDNMAHTMREEYANVHRGLHFLSNGATIKYEDARRIAARFLNAQSDSEIIFTSGATDAINLVADSYGGDFIAEDDEIILSTMEHHSNVVPWHYLRQRKGAVIKWADITDEGDLDLDAFEKLFTSRTKIVAITHASNVTGTITPAKEIIRIAHDRGVPVLFDGCQAVMHDVVDVQDLDVDFYVFSGHKIYGPTGSGILYGKSKWLERMRPYRGGGAMIEEVKRDAISYAAPPQRFEAGTPAIVEAIALGAALDYFMGFDRTALLAHEHDLLSYATGRVQEINSLRVIGTSHHKASILSFVMEGAHPHDISTIIDRSGVAIRAGHHCAQPLMDRFGVTSTARASFAMYNTRAEVDRFIEALFKAREFLS
jgi:cysteine desulfurase/selenocysteine lyase